MKGALASLRNRENLSERFLDYLMESNLELIKSMEGHLGGIAG